VDLYLAVRELLGITALRILLEEKAAEIVIQGAAPAQQTQVMEEMGKVLVIPLPGALES
jgi:hypothetical protein